MPKCHWVEYPICAICEGIQHRWRACLLKENEMSCGGGEHVSARKRLLRQKVAKQHVLSFSFPFHHNTIPWRVRKRRRCYNVSQQHDECVNGNGTGAGYNTKLYSRQPRYQPHRKTNAAAEGRWRSYISPGAYVMMDSGTQKW